MVHHVGDAAVQRAGDLHDLRRLAADVGDPEFGGGAEGGLVVRRAGRAVERRVEVGQRLADRGAEIGELEVPLAGDRALGDDRRDAVGGRSAEQHRFRVRDLAGADLDRVHVHDAALVLVAISEEEGGGLEGTTRGVETLVGGPVVLLDAVDELGDDRGVGGLVVRGDDPVPSARGEGAAAFVAVAALAEVAALPEQVAVIGVAQRAGLEQRGGSGPGGVDIEVEDQRVLVDLGAAAVGLDAVVHHVGDAAVQRAGDLHDLRGLSADVGDPELGGGAEGGLVVRRAGRSVECRVEVGQGLADVGEQVGVIEVPLAGGRARGDRLGDAVG